MNPHLFSHIMIEWHNKHFHIVPTLKKMTPYDSMADIYVDMILLAQTPEAYLSLWRQQDTMKGRLFLFRVALELQCPLNQILSTFAELHGGYPNSVQWRILSQAFCDYIYPHFLSYSNANCDIIDNMVLFSSIETEHKRNLYMQLPPKVCIHYCDFFKSLMHKIDLTHNIIKDSILLYKTQDVRKLTQFVAHYYNHTEIVYLLLVNALIDDDVRQTFLESLEIGQDDLAHLDIHQALFNINTMEGFQSYLQHIHSERLLTSEEITLIV